MKPTYRERLDNTDVSDITDELCSAVIKGLDNADFEVNIFEASFIESNLERTKFSDRQKAVVVLMIEKYKGKFEY